MNVLLTNDDGIDAPGIWALHTALSKAGHKVYIVAPRLEKSACSHAISTRDPMRISEHQEGVYSVTGTPADCVILAFEQILQGVEIDFVVSGINTGQNLSDDILYSGTVAGAVEASRYGKRAIAISVTSYVNCHFETACKVLLKLLDAGILDFAGYREPINVNVPNIAFEKIAGYTVCVAGFSKYQNIVHLAKDHRGNEIIWLGGEKPLIEESDFEIDHHAIKEHKVSITPLEIDLNAYEKLAEMSRHFDDLLGGDDEV